VSSGLREQLQAIYDQHGRLTPAIVVEEARAPDHPLHHELEWDNEIAGEAYRLQQAHELIQRVRIAYKTAPGGERRSLRAFQAVRGEDGYRYEPTERVVHDPFLSRLVMADMEREWRQLKRRYEHFAEFWDLIRGDAGEEAA